MNQKPNFAVDAESMNAIVSAMGATVMALADSMPAEQRTKFAASLARLAKSAELHGHTTLETLLIDLHRAATL